MNFVIRGGLVPPVARADLAARPHPGRAREAVGQGRRRPRRRAPEAVEARAEDVGLLGRGRVGAISVITQSRRRESVSGAWRATRPRWAPVPITRTWHVGQVQSPGRRSPAAWPLAPGTPAPGGPPVGAGRPPGSAGLAAWQRKHCSARNA